MDALPNDRSAGAPPAATTATVAWGGVVGTVPAGHVEERLGGDA